MPPRTPQHGGGKAHWLSELAIAAIVLIFKVIFRLLHLPFLLFFGIIQLFENTTFVLLLLVATLYIFGYAPLFIALFKEILITVQCSLLDGLFTWKEMIDHALTFIFS
jgi:hypothetical protein